MDCRNCNADLKSKKVLTFVPPSFVRVTEIAVLEILACPRYNPFDSIDALTLLRAKLTRIVGDPVTERRDLATGVEDWPSFPDWFFIKGPRFWYTFQSQDSFSCVRFAAISSTLADIFH